MPHGQCCDPGGPALEQCVGIDEDRLGSLVRKCRKCSIQLLLFCSADDQNFEIHARGRGTRLLAVEVPIRIGRVHRFCGPTCRVAGHRRPTQLAQGAILALQATQLPGRPVRAPV